MSDELQVHFAQILKAHREKQNLSQEGLAFLAGLDRTYISLLERGGRRPTLRTLWALCHALKIKPSDFVAELEAEVP